MLRKFAVSNFKGFKDRIELDLSKTRNYEFNGFAIKNGIVKDSIIYGPNGSGKSNLGYAIFDILMHLSQKWKRSESYVNTTYGWKVDSLMSFEYTFDFSGQIVQYDYMKDSKENLVSETLSVDGRTVFSTGPDVFEFDGNEFPISEEAYRQLRNNSNSPSIVNYLYASFPLPDGHYLKSLKDFVDSMLWFRCLEDRGFMGLLSNTVSLGQFVIENNLFDDFSRFLQEVSGQKYSFASAPGDNKNLYCVIDGNRIPFAAVMSTGTSSLFLLYFWLKNMKGASLVFIDEFDAFYHFKLAESVCRQLFALDDTQVILTSHNTYLMTNDLLRPDCNLILKDNVIKPLCDCTEKELRWGHNIEKMYRGGAFEV